MQVDPVTHKLMRDNDETEVNPSDLNAVTAAIKLKNAISGTVDVFTMGPPAAEKALITCLAMGADEAYLLTDYAFSGSDSLGTAKVLATAIRHTDEYDLILCGDASSDGATGQVGPMLAELLKIPSATDVRRVENCDNNKIQVLRTFKDQRVRLKISLPCLITVGIGSNAVILPTLRSQMKANKKTILHITNKDLNLDGNTIGLHGAKSSVIETYARAGRAKQAIMLSGSAKEVAEQMMNLIGKEESAT